MPFSKKSKGEFYFDELDIKILKVFTELNGKEVKMWKMMQNIFDKEIQYLKNQNKSRKYFEDQCYKKMSERIKSLSKIGLIHIEKKQDGTPVYEIYDNQLLFKSIKMPNGVKNFIAGLVDGYWQLIEYR